MPFLSQAGQRRLREGNWFAQDLSAPRGWRQSRNPHLRDPEPLLQVALPLIRPPSLWPLRLSPPLDDSSRARAISFFPVCCLSSLLSPVLGMRQECTARRRGSSGSDKPRNTNAFSCTISRNLQQSSEWPLAASSHSPGMCGLVRSMRKKKNPASNKGKSQSCRFLSLGWRHPTLQGWAGTGPGAAGQEEVL